MLYDIQTDFVYSGHFVVQNNTIYLLRQIYLYANVFIHLPNRMPAVKPLMCRPSLKFPRTAW